MILSPSGEKRATCEIPSPIRSWMSCVPEARSSITIDWGLKSLSCSTTARVEQDAGRGRGAGDRGSSDASPECRILVPHYD